MSILVFLEHDDGELSKGALCTITAAKQAKDAHGHDKIIGLVCGSGSLDAVTSAAAEYPLDEVLSISSDALEHPLAVPLAQAVVAAAEDCGASLVLGLAGTTGKDMMPRVAEQLQAAQASDVLAFVADERFKRPMFAGDIIATVELTT